MSGTYIAAVDQSTSGTKVLVMEPSGRIIARSSLPHRQYYPQAGWAEHDALEIYENVKRTIKQALDACGVRAEQLAALTITNQRETALIWDRTTGEPIAPAIVWQCQRTADMCQQLREAGHESLVRSRTGLMLDPYFSASKWRWLLDHVSGAREQAARGELLAGTIDSWLVWKLSGGKVHATDVTNASRTQLFNIYTLSWDEELCELFDVPLSMLPEVRHSDEIFGYTADPDLFAEHVPITGVIGDSQAALFGQQCLQPGMVKATYGTGTSVLMNIGDQPAASTQGTANTIAWGQGGKVTYALEAIIRSTGDSIKWIRDHLGLFSDYDELDALVSSVEDHGGVYLIPAFAGLGAPYWAPEARAAIIGLSRGSHKGHIVRAALESIAYQVRDGIELLEAESGVKMTTLYTDGGASDNRWLMQFQADLLSERVMKSNTAELSALGSIYLGGLAVGIWQQVEDLPAGDYTIYQPAMADDERTRLYEGWKQAVRMVLS